MIVGSRLYYTDPAPSGRWYVYALHEPGNDVVRYVGSSPWPQRRLHQHIQTAGQKPIGTNGATRVQAWIHGLVADGTYPWMEILEIVDTRAEAIRAEWRHVARFRETVVNGYPRGPIDSDYQVVSS